jgi:putative transposase
MCKSMKISKNAYSNWLEYKGIKVVKASKLLLKERIKVIFEESKEIYGSHRVQKMLERENLCYSRSYVGFLMNEMGLRSVLKRKHVITRGSSHSEPIADNVLCRDFETYNLGEKWVSDITYIRVKDNWNYLTTVIDLADRKVIGWSLSEDMTAKNTVLKAFQSARQNRSISSNLIFHSDRGTQYASGIFSNIFKHNKRMVQSMSRKGNCWDNAVSESFFKTIKYECLYRYKFMNYNHLYSTICDYIDWYNIKRLHSSLGYLSPLEKEIELRGLFKRAA